MDIEQLCISRNTRVMIDRTTLEVFDSKSKSNWTLKALRNRGIKESICFLLDGRYIAMITQNRRQIAVFRTNDGYQKAKIYVHGCAYQLCVASDDRTLLIGCNDGRVMTFTLVLESADPVHDIVKKLPSRILKCWEYGKNLIESDVCALNPTFPELKQLSNATQIAYQERKKRSPSFKSVGTAVMLTQQNNARRTSQACTII